MMQNDITRVIVNFPPDVSEEVNVKAFGAFADALAELPTILCGIVYSNPGRVETHISFVSGPARGSIIFHLFARVEINVHVESHRNFIGGVGPALQAAAAIAGIGSFIWVLAFGGKSLPELLKGTQVPPPEQVTAENVHVVLAGMIANDDRIAGAIRKLRVRAGGLGGSEVYIQYRDDPPVRIWAGDERQSPALFGKERNVDSLPPGRRLVSAQGPFMEVEYQNRRYEAFIGELRVVNEPRAAPTFKVAIIWGSQAQRPLTVPEVRKVQQHMTERPRFIEVDGEVVQSKDAVIPLGVVPPEFEQVQVVYFVSSVITRK